MNAGVRHGIFLAIYLVLTLIAALSADYRLPHEWLYWSKPCIMGSLLVYLLVLSPKPIASVLIGFAFLASLAGDVFLMRESESSFLYGLGSFLMAHLTYVYLNVKAIDSAPLQIPLLRKHPWIIFSSILYALWVYLQVKDGAGEIAWAVLVYVLIILFMWLTAWYRHGRVASKAFLYGVIGAGLFLVSDSLLAYDRFVRPIEYRSLAVLSSYALAQYFLFRAYALPQLDGAHPES